MSNWLHSEERLSFRSQCLYMLLSEFGHGLSKDGTPLHSSRALYECAHDWVSQGHPTVNGITTYYLANYTNRG